MFKNIKNLSEFSLLNERLIAITVPGAGANDIVYPWPEVKEPEAKEEVEAVDNLAKLRELMQGNFKKHLEDYESAVLGFLNSEEASTYEPGEWKKWNVELLKFMNFEVSEDDSKGVITRLQEYLKTVDSTVQVDGKFGANLRDALRRYYKEPASEESWVTEKTKASFEANNRTYYLTNEGVWVDWQQKAIDIKEIAPKLAKDGKTNSRQYYELSGSNGHTYYVDRHGNTYQDAMPEYDGSTKEEYEKGFGSYDPYEEQSEDPRKRAKEYLVNSITNIGEVEHYYRYPNGKFTNEKGELVEAKDIVPRVLRYTATALIDGQEQKVYGVETHDGKIAYYNEEGELVIIVEETKRKDEDDNPYAEDDNPETTSEDAPAPVEPAPPSELEAPAPVEPTPAPAPAPVPVEEPAPSESEPPLVAAVMPRTVGLGDAPVVDGPTVSLEVQDSNEARRLSEEEAEKIINNSALNNIEARPDKILDKENIWLAFPSRQALVTHLNKERPNQDWATRLRGLNVSDSMKAAKTDVVSQTSEAEFNLGQAVAFFENGKITYYLVKKTARDKRAS